ncbi:DUF4376 domain-containing protein [Escherichia coli]|uniref:DUF4376 domain-containing protein n=1 Tax=Escherichia coli TaxID=562 RepID=UPI001C401E23|nr:DUF4376 domain-containing protein [Escherichia coli]
MKIRAVKGIRNAHYLENGAVDCEVLFEGETEFVPYTVIQDDTALTGQHIWEELQSGKWGAIAPFTVTPELIAAAKDAKKREINTWRTEQEAKAWTLEWEGRNWDAGPDSLARLYPVVMAAKGKTSRSTLAWGDTSNQQVTMSLQKLEELLTAMAQKQVDRNDEIYHQQRKMKDTLNTLVTLEDIRAYKVKE